MNENLENRCMSLHDEALQSSAPTGADIDTIITSLNALYSRIGGWMTIDELNTVFYAKELLKEYKAIKPLIDDIS